MATRNKAAAVSEAVLDAPLAYAARGWAVLPVRARSKVPLTGHGVYDATGKCNRGPDHAERKRLARFNNLSPNATRGLWLFRDRQRNTQIEVL